MDVEGPLPADTLFFRASRGDFDMVVAMYHDQGHAPIKVLGIEAGVNITVGLPVIRTSVDHGTAFDLAGTGAADERSMIEALRQAAELAQARKTLEQLAGGLPGEPSQFQRRLRPERVGPLRAYRGPETQPKTTPCPKAAWSRVLRHPTEP